MKMGTMSEPTFRSSADVVLTGVVAVVGCDGTGKSTLTADLLENLKKRGSAERRYMGLVSGEMGEKIKQLPLIGVRLEQHLAEKAQRAQDMNLRLPGIGTALIMYALSWWRAAQLVRLRRLSRNGVLVVADRYPQAEIPGFRYDGPGLTVDRTSSGLVHKLAAREQKLYEWMARHKPALVIRLNIDADTAHRRKPDHSLSELRDKISVMPRLTFNGASICEIDARAPYADVLAAALAAVDAVIQPVADT